MKTTGFVLVATVAACIGWILYCSALPSRQHEIKNAETAKPATSKAPAVQPFVAQRRPLNLIGPASTGQNRLVVAPRESTPPMIQLQPLPAKSSHGYFTMSRDGKVTNHVRVP